VRADEEMTEWIVMDEVREDEDEEMLVEEETAGKKKRVRRMVCPVCGERCRHLSRHAAQHLPWFWYPSTCCQDCCSQLINNNLLEHHEQKKHQRHITPEWNNTRLATFIQDYLLALGKKLGINSLDEFISYINQDQKLKIICTRKQFTKSDLELCQVFDTIV
jgi:hypothetical protein